MSKSTKIEGYHCMTNYKAVYEKGQAEINHEAARLTQLRADAQTFYAMLFEEAQKAAKKAIKSRKKGTITLPKETIETLREAVFSKYPGVERAYETLTEMRETLNRQLGDLAETTKLKPDSLRSLTCVKTCNYWCFSTQTCPDFYAKASLLPLAWKLHQAGFTVKGFFQEERVELWANADEWQVDCAERQLTIKESLAAMGRVTNPFVIYTNLFPQALADWHYANSQDPFALDWTQQS